MWKFGEEPLEQTQRFAAVARRVVALALQMEQPTDALDELIAALEAAEAKLEPQAPKSPLPRIGDAHEGEGRLYLDHSSDVGRYNPAFPLYEIEVEGDRASGTVSFPLLFEGPPGIVHGGFLGLLFDQVIQHHNCALDQAGKTTRLEVRYLAPTPLLVPLRFEVERRLDGKRIESTARLFHGDTACAEATMRAVAGRREGLPAAATRRPA